MKRRILPHRIAYPIFRRLFWLPAPVYYRLNDWLCGLNGWRPLGYGEAPPQGHAQPGENGASIDGRR